MGVVIMATLDIFFRFEHLGRVVGVGDLYI